MSASPDFDLVAIGEYLIDFVPLKAQQPGTIAFSGCPGGAPANVCAAATRLGLRTAFIGKVGEDIFGRLLKDSLDGNGVDTSSLVVSAEHPTTLAFVAVDERGDRSFSFYRNQTADCMLECTDIDRDLLRAAPLFHFGSVSLSKEPARAATIFAVTLARESGALISYDPNLRALLWDDLEDARQMIRETLPLADFIKLSEEELVFVTGQTDIEAGMRQLYEAGTMKLLVVTLGEKGSVALNENGFAQHRGFPVEVVDTVGAGDAFWGALLSQLHGSEADVKTIPATELEPILRFANAAGALSTTQPGATTSLPTLKEIEAFISKQS